MSLSKRDSPYANSGLVVTVPLEAFEGADVLAGMRLQERYETRAYELGRVLDEVEDLHPSMLAAAAARAVII